MEGETAYHLRIKVEATKISRTVVWLILIISREHVHMATIPLGCIFSILTHTEHKSKTQITMQVKQTVSIQKSRLLP